MTQTVDSGIPLISDYDRLLGSRLFREMEKFSDTFLATNSNILEAYGRRWTSDPLHQWSRQWEYPYCYSKITGHLEALGNSGGNAGAKILDAGSGATFFPHYISANAPGSTVVCLDQDRTLPGIYAKINAASDSRVRFELGDLHKLPFADGEFDIIYCISVLEHTDDYQKIIDEFRRVLKKGGILIVTFDISIDGNADIPPDGARNLIQAIRSKFEPQGTLDDETLLKRVYRDNILSTQHISKVNKALLPWAFPRLVALKALARFRIPRSLLLNLTVGCCVFRA
jgi:ubiquinone/menaquinone biosynthesis C-methylase UbiE